MAISDQYFRKDGTPTAKYGQGNRWRIRWHGESESFPDVNRKDGPQPNDRIPRNVEAAWARMRTAERKRTQDLLVGDLLDRWLATKKGLSPRGYRACLDAAAHIRAEWGDELAHNITQEAVQIWIAGLEWSPSLKHKLIQCLSGALDLAGLSKNPCAGVKVPKEKRREARWLTVDDIGRLASECHGYEALIWTLGTTGLRIGEACALNVGDVDRRRGRLRVRMSKSGVGRDVPVPSKVLAMFDLSRPKDAPLLTAAGGSRVLKDNFRARHFKPAASRAGFDGLRIHDLRHAAASLAIASGAVATDVATMLGHADPSLTLRIYTERWDKGLDDVSKRMDDMIGGDDE